MISEIFLFLFKNDLQIKIADFSDSKAQSKLTSDSVETF